MGLGKNQTNVFAYTVPKGFTLYVTKFLMTMTRANGANGSAEMSVRMKSFDSNGFRAVRNPEITQAQNYVFNGKAYFVAPELTDIVGRVEDVSDNNTICYGEADGFLKDNSL